MRFLEVPRGPTDAGALGLADQCLLVPVHREIVSNFHTKRGFLHPVRFILKTAYTICRDFFLGLKSMKSAL